MTHLPKAAPPNTIAGGIRFQPTNSGRTQAFSPSHCVYKDRRDDEEERDKESGPWVLWELLELLLSAYVPGSPFP